MRALHGLLLSVTLGAAAFAAPVAAPKPPEKILVWVTHTFMGGPKCVNKGPVQHFEPPGFAAEKEKLRRAGVFPAREYFRDHATCEACQKCANYHREILFEILQEQLEAANKTGYNKTPPPTAAELNEYEAGKRFRAKPDIGAHDD